MAPTEYVTAERMARRWGVCLRTVHYYCERGKIPGAFKESAVWKIPIHAQRPADGRKRYVWDDTALDYSPEQWSYALSYITGEDVRLSTLTEVDEYLKSRQEQ